MDVVSFVFNYFKLVALFVCFADSEFGLVFNIYCLLFLICGNKFAGGLIACFIPFSFCCFWGSWGLERAGLLFPCRNIPLHQSSVNFLGSVSAVLCMCGVSVVRALLKPGV